MNEIKTLLDSRNKSGFDLSIGTGLCLETIFSPNEEVYDKSRVVPKKPNLSSYETHYISLITLIRNIINSSRANKLILTNIGDSVPLITEIVIEEIETLTELYASPEAMNVVPIFYTLDYSVLERNTGTYVKLRESSTDNQIRLNQVHDGVLNELSKRGNYYIDLGIKIPSGKILITTSNAYDLLSYKDNSVFDLLESHTGKLKTYTEFNSKYSVIKGFSLSRLPFMEKIFYIFGDKNTVKPMSISIRKNILKIAEDNNFTPVTTESKVKYYLEKIPELKEIYRKLPKLI